MTDQPDSEAPVSAVDRYARLGGIDRSIAEMASKPRWLMYFATATSVVIAWIWLAFLAAGAAGTTGSGALGPGMGVWQEWLSVIDAGAADNALLFYILKICAPQSPDGFGINVFASTFGMWMAMSFAMMLPSAAPMLLTYGDIADVAVQKNQKTVPLFVLAAGYLAVWFMFSFLITVFQLALIRAGLATDPVYPLRGLFAGAILMLAGGYQFSALKNACLEKCRNPFAILFGRWSQKTSAIFKLGMEQGLFCLGCCWALMLVMLVVGTMNLAWMAFFTLFAIVEKSGKGKVTSYLSGGILLAWGGILSLTSILSI